MVESWRRLLAPWRWVSAGDAQGAGSFVGAAQSPLRGEGRRAPAFPRQELGDRSAKHSPCYSTATSTQACRGAGGNSPGSLHLHAPSRSANTNPLLPEPSGPHPAWHLLAELRPRRVSPAASGEPRAGEEARGCSAPSDAEVPRDGLAGAAPALFTCFGDVSGKVVQSRPHEALEMPPPRSQGGICKTSTLEEVPGPSAQAGASEGRAKGPWEARAA